MGKYSRDKGKRAEYEIRDVLRKHGFQADRVPSSGAAQGFKGDIRARKGTSEYLFEVKARATGFDAIYRVFAQDAVAGVMRVALQTPGNQTLICIADNPDSALQYAGEYRRWDVAGSALDQKRAWRKLLNARAWLQTCHCLVLKQDRCKPLFITYT